MNLQEIVDGLDGWTVTKAGKRVPHLELRKKYPQGDLFILVSDGNGYDYKHYASKPDRWGRGTKGVNVHLSTNGPIQMTFDETQDIQTVVERCKEYFLVNKSENV